jgi:hypothetical protein
MLLKLVAFGLFAYGFFSGCAYLINKINAAHAAEAANVEALLRAAGLS